MTTLITRLAEIAERETFETWVRSHPDNQGFQDRAAWLLSRYDDGQYQWKETHDRWIAWQGATSAAQARSREDAEIMREAAAQLEDKLVCCEPWLEDEGHHKRGCLVTKLRKRADQLGGSK